jgi:hypothetical protein
LWKRSELVYVLLGHSLAATAQPAVQQHCAHAVCMTLAETFSVTQWVALVAWTLVHPAYTAV